MVAMIILLVMVTGFLGALATGAFFAPQDRFEDRESELIGKTIGLTLLTLSVGVVVSWLAQ